MNSKFSYSPETFKELELMVLHTDYHSNPQLIDQLIAHDFEEIDKFGQNTQRSDVVAWLLNKDPSLRWDLLDFRVKPVCAEVVICIYNAKLKSADPAIRGSSRSSLWRYSSGTWQMVFHQASKS